MLKQRILTAVVLLVVLVAALLARNPAWFAALSLLFITAAGWEWGRLNAGRPAVHWVTALVTLLICLLLGLAWQGVGGQRLLQETRIPWWLAGLAWLVIGPLLLWLGVARWRRVPEALRLAGGVIALCLAWGALVLWRLWGVNTLLSVMALVWAADVGAYAAGRTWGRHKLAPSISPGKSREGVVGGWVAVAVLALVWLGVDAAWGDRLGSPSIYTMYRELFGVAGLIGALWLLACMSVVGDLVESLVKRSAGMKDSSQLLPGHGGVLDRIDALLPTLPLAFALLALAIAGRGL